MAGLMGSHLVSWKADLDGALEGWSDGCSGWLVRGRRTWGPGRLIRWCSGRLVRWQALDGWSDGRRPLGVLEGWSDGVLGGLVRRLLWMVGRMETHLGSWKAGQREKNP